MAYRITAEEGYLKARLIGRETVEETRVLLRAIVSAIRKHNCTVVLLDVRSSRPLFNIAQHGLLECLSEMANNRAFKFALLGDTRDLRISHEYFALLAQQKGLNVRSFLDDATALQWFRLDERREKRELSDRRRREERRFREERRRAERRAYSEMRHGTP
jgi:hypothetical protein